MKNSSNDQAKGLFQQVKGSTKEVTGKISDNLQLEAEGAGEKVGGKVREKIGQLKKLLGF